MQIDHRLLVERRRELGLSQRSVAHAAGLSLTAARNLEATGDASFLTLKTLSLVAGAVGVTVPALLSAPAPISTTPRADDERVLLPEVGAALLRYRDDGLSVDALAVALGRPEEEIENALAALSSLITAAGMVLHRRGRQVVLVPAAVALTPDALRAAVTKTGTRPKLASGDATFVYEAMSESRSAKGQRANANGVLRTGRLRNIGLLKEPEKETNPMLLSEEVRFALMLDDRQGPTDDRDQ